MTVKDLMLLLQFYPVDADVFVECGGKLSEFDEVNETTNESKKAALVLTVKDSDRKIS